MATLNKQVIGKLSGTIGDLVFRQRNGKNIISSRPKSPKPTNDPKVLARRSKFKLSVQLAKSINSIPQLSEQWKAKAPEGFSPFNYMVKFNYDFIDPDSIPGLIYMSPVRGFDVNNPSVTFNADSIAVNVDAIGNNDIIDINNETSVILAAVLYLDNPSDENSAPNFFISLASNSQSLVTDTALTFNMSLSDIEAQVIAIYQDKKPFLALLTLDGEGKVVHNSNTFTG